MYSRFKALEDFDQSDLETLQNSTAAVVGLGATGSVIAENLARHGLELILIDRDYLEINDCYSSNIYTPEQCRKSIPKAEAADQYLSKFTETEKYICSLNSDNIDLLEKADIILDGTDNLETRFLIDEYCQKNSKPWIYTSALAEKGYSMFLESKCFSCIFEKVTDSGLETCETAGIMREVSGIAGLKSALKAVKYLSGRDVSENLETVEGESFEIEDSSCKVCKAEKFPHLESDIKTTAVCGENKYQVKKDLEQIDLEKLENLMENTSINSYLVRGSYRGSPMTFFRDGRAIIQAEDKGHAEAVYSEIVGN